MRLFKVVVVMLVIAAILGLNEAKKRRRKMVKSTVLRQRETNAIDFIRLTVMRVIYGVATRVGLGEEISEALNGAFVPPGVDDYDYGGFNLLDREDDYDY